MSFFCDARVTFEDRTLEFSAAEGQALEGAVNTWYGGGDPSSWLATATFLAVRSKFPDVPQRVLLELSAHALGIPVDRLVGLIRWYEQYMRWHDGEPGEPVLEG